MPRDGNARDPPPNNDEVVILGWGSAYGAMKEPVDLMNRAKDSNQNHVQKGKADAGWTQTSD